MKVGGQAGSGGRQRCSTRWAGTPAASIPVCLPAADPHPQALDATASCRPPAGSLPQLGFPADRAFSPPSRAQALAAYGILSAPVSDAVSGEYVGMLDVADIVRGVVQGAAISCSAAVELVVGVGGRVRGHAGTWRTSCAAWCRVGGSAACGQASVPSALAAWWVGGRVRGDAGCGRQISGARGMVQGEGWASRLAATRWPPGPPCPQPRPCHPPPEPHLARQACTPSCRSAASWHCQPRLPPFTFCRRVCPLLLPARILPGVYPELLERGFLEQHRRLSISELQSGGWGGGGGGLGECGACTNTHRAAGVSRAVRERWPAALGQAAAAALDSTTPAPPPPRTAPRSSGRGVLLAQAVQPGSRRGPVVQGCARAPMVSCITCWLPFQSPEGQPAVGPAAGARRGTCGSRVRVPRPALPVPSLPRDDPSVTSVAACAAAACTQGCAVPGSPWRPASHAALCSPAHPGQLPLPRRRHRVQPAGGGRVGLPRAVSARCSAAPLLRCGVLAAWLGRARRPPTRPPARPPGPHSPRPEPAGHEPRALASTCRSTAAAIWCRWHRRARLSAARPAHRVLVLPRLATLPLRPQRACQGALAAPPPARPPPDRCVRHPAR